jgi:hypothetical protein
MACDLEKLQCKSARIFGTGYMNGVPFGKIRRAIVREFEKAGLEPPRDVIGFAFPGLSDDYIQDWESGLDTSAPWLANLDH